VRRGDLVTVAVQGDDGKPRLALVIPSDHFRALGSVTVLPITSELADAPLLRLALEPGPGNGPQKVSQVMIDKAVTVRLDKIGAVFGRIDNAALAEVDRRLAVFLGIAH
jgi:mRNA interferase MazF